MCGIAGFCNMPENWRENIARMNNRMLHRGPDSEGVWASDKADVVLGHRRLSILDLSSTGSQPMMSASGRHVIAFNGEIYNHKELAERLLKEKKISRFHGTSDTEILLEACEAYGFENTLNMAKGMFAVAVYDIKNRELKLARDRMGEKPLYYGFLGGKFAFASEIGVLKENLYFENELDREALTLYFNFGYIPAPYSVYKGIKKLEAGSVLSLRAPFLEVETHKYWDVMQVAREGQNNIFKGTEAEAADHLEYLLKESIRQQMVADVPVGAFLSGGIDSTAVVAVMQSLSSKKIRTFTIGLGEQAYNEAEFAKETADYLGTEHTELYISDKDAQAVIPKLAYIYGEPFADSSQIPTYLVSKLAKEKVTVSLSGDGGDELFAGYNTYRLIDNIWKNIRYIPYSLRKGMGRAAMKMSSPVLKKVGKCFLARSAENMYEFIGSLKEEPEFLVKQGRMPSYKYSEYPNGYLKETVLNIMLMDMLMYHPDDILTKVDRAGMAVSLELRIPMLDRDILEYAWTLPLAYKRKGNVGKRVLRNVLYRYVPQEMMERPKTGFSVPVGKWIRDGELREWAEELLDESALRQQGILDEKLVRRVWDCFIKTGEGERIVWYLLMFEEWVKEN